MNNLLRALADESVLVLGLVAALVSAAGASEAWTKVATAAVPLVLAVLVRQVTSAPSTVVEVARQTAESLSGSSAGTVGTVTAKGEDVINDVVSGVGGLVGRLAPRLGEE
jgi:hypothetical protein